MYSGMGQTGRCNPNPPRRYRRTAGKQRRNHRAVDAVDGQAEWICRSALGKPGALLLAPHYPLKGPKRCLDQVFGNGAFERRRNIRWILGFYFIPIRFVTDNFCQTGLSVLRCWPSTTLKPSSGCINFTGSIVYYHSDARRRNHNGKENPGVRNGFVTSIRSHSRLQPGRDVRERNGNFGNPNFE